MRPSLLRPPLRSSVVRASARGAGGRVRSPTASHQRRKKLGGLRFSAKFKGSSRLRSAASGFLTLFLFLCGGTCLRINFSVLEAVQLTFRCKGESKIDKQENFNAFLIPNDILLSTSRLCYIWYKVWDLSILYVLSAPLSVCLLAFCVCFCAYVIHSFFCLPAFCFL